MLPNTSKDAKLLSSCKSSMLKYITMAFTIRLIMIFFIYVFENKLGTHLYLDDIKYETYAKIYKAIAKSAIDFNSFESVDKKMGGIAVAQLYFRLNAVLYYVTGSVFFLRLVNILFSSLTIIPIFLISKELFGIKQAKISSFIFAIMPYHIMMSSFLFKDILITLIMSISIYMVIKFYKYDNMNWFVFISLTLSLEWLRNGLPIFVFGVLILAIWLKKYKTSKFIRMTALIIVPSILIIVMYVLADSFELLASRLELYMNHGRDYSGGINIIRIDHVSQVYKLPLTWFFSTIFPISFNIKLDSWSEIMSILNYTSIFISPAYILYTLFYKKSTLQKIIFYPILLLHLLIIIALINVPRHYYFLNIYIIIFGSAYLSELNNKKIKEYVTITMFMCISFILVALFL